MELDYRQCTKEEIFSGLEKLTNNEITGISIKNIISSEARDLLNIDDIEDFNGWQCDWWAKCEYNGVRLAVSGGAWYGTLAIDIDDKEDEE